MAGSLVWHRMTRPTQKLQRTAITASLVVAFAASACADDSPSGLGKQQLSVSSDTIVGTGQLAELQQRRAAWIARGIDDYRVELRISCFCGGDITRPVLVEVRNGVVSKVWDLETGKPVANLEPYPTITALFDKAIAERSRGGHVSVAYDRQLGFPARLEVGTVANDAGVLYFLGVFTT